eukprot:CAMPEP_0201659244 /NCGR_PEP_ID=MMETSP0494-20130426/2073_1 /ASSEMBLY_ACC=CAM_ASM_000839 /TAXON_ID=420259 /ORGANISM="Thalassiosira gravida, Strain GMp14c1" /LENGTH=1406 /DNA_ID=CAMNT_0048136659 /DNA_START=18 /DNA_END=4238 /DNA_ORIENTATION=+
MPLRQMKHLAPFVVLLSTLCSCCIVATTATTQSSVFSRIRNSRSPLSGVGTTHRRRLDEGEWDDGIALELANYSIKYESCHNANYHQDADDIATTEGEEEEEEVRGSSSSSIGGRQDGRRLEDYYVSTSNSNGQIPRGSVVTFRLCASHSSPDSTTSCDESSCDDSGYGEIVIDMVSYLQAMIEYRWEKQEIYCMSCSYQIDPFACYDECEPFENMEEHGFFDATDFVECQELDGIDGDQQYYAGAVCVENDNSQQGASSRIEIGVFLDEYCTVHDATKNVEDYLNIEDGDGSLLGMKLSYKVLNSTYDTSDCLANCLVVAEEDLNNGNEFEESIPEIEEVCQYLFYASGLYEDFWPGDYENIRPPTPAESNVETCMFQNAAGTYFAGRFCEYEATSVCGGFDAGSGPRFCTNNGICALEDNIAISSGCTCRPDFYGKYCELVVEGADVESWESTDHEDHGDGGSGWTTMDDAWDDAWADDDEALAGDALDELDEIISFISDIDPSNYTAREHSALVALYILTAGDSWTNNDGWFSDSNVCEWHGVSCDTGQSVSTLDLSWNSMRGSFSDIYNVCLRGLANLTVLDLGNNQIRGSIPADFDLQRLTHLELGNNALSGFIPSSLSMLPQLRLLELQGNYFTSVLMNNGYSSLEYLDLGDNQIFGAIQPSISRLNRLKFVSLRSNRLIAGLADDYSLLANLTDFDVSNNMLSGVFPEKAFSNNPKLQYLNVSRNNIAGPIPENIMKAAFESSNEAPYALDLSFNIFEGTMPNFDVDVLDINVVGNKLEGIDSMACDHEFWNGGATQSFGCGGIACPNGTANSEGRQTSGDDPCVQCNVSSYYGTVGCQLDTFEGKEDVDDDPFIYDDDDYDYDDDGVSSMASVSNLQILSPESLVKPGGYHHQVLLFGPPIFSGSANVYYTDSELCDETMEDDGNLMSSWVPPFILMLDRGACTDVTKVRNAQNAGAMAVVIADNTCLCDAGESCVSAPNEECDKISPVFPDDGSAWDIFVPAFLMLKQDAVPIKEELTAGNDVVMELALSQFEVNTIVWYELWTSPTDIISREFLLGFKESAQALSGHAYFIPRLFIDDGIKSGCIGGRDDLCSKLCTNGGRYCATPPGEDLDGSISGADIVTESLRWICIWNLFAEDRVRPQWWEYIVHFIEDCVNPGLFGNEECVNNAMEKADIDPQLVIQCMDEHGGLEGDTENKLLWEQLHLKQEQGISAVPTFRVNQSTISGTFNPDQALETICAGFTATSAPPVCQSNVELGPPSSPVSSTSVLRPTPPPVASTSVVLSTPPPALASFDADEDNYVEEYTTLPSTPPSIQSSLVVTPLSINVTFNSTMNSEPSSLEPSSAPSSQVTMPLSISDVTPEPTSTATDTDADFNSGQTVFTHWQHLLVLIQLVFL